MRRFRIGVLGATALALTLVIGACGSGGDDEESDPGAGGEKGSLTVGSDAFYEAQILGEMYAQVLEDEGYEVSRQLDIETREVRLPAMYSGEIDIAPEYLSSLLSVLDPQTEGSGDPDEVVQDLEPLLEEKGLELLEPSDAIDVNAFVVTPELAEEHDLAAVSDLAPVAGELTLGAPAECPKRPYCLPGLKKTYGIEFESFESLKYGAPTVQALTAGEIDVALLFSTDPLIEEQGLVLLEDDKQLQQADYMTPLVRSEVLEPAIEERLNEVSATITTADMTALNARVLVDQEDAADVAAEYLEEKGLLD